MSDVLNINMQQESGGCQTIKYNGSNVKTLKINGTTIWQHKARKVQSYDSPTFNAVDLSHADAWELETQPDHYDMTNTYLDLYPSYEYSSSKGIRGTGSRINDRRDFKANTWYYHGGDWTSEMYRTKANFTTAYYGGDTPGTWGTDQDTGETWYGWHEPISKITQERLVCNKNYTWVVD